MNECGKTVQDSRGTGHACNRRLGHAPPCIANYRGGRAIGHGTVIRGLAPSVQAILEQVGKDNLAAVVTETLRDDQGITYTVKVESRADNPDGRLTVWSNASPTDDIVVGGGAFDRLVAREQERIAAEIWAWAKAR